MSMEFIRVFLRVFFLIFGRVLPILVFLAGIITGTAPFLARLEHISFGNAVYFAWITATTVGYGDFSPHTSIAKLICVLLAIVGIINTGMLVAVAINAVRIAIGQGPDLDTGRACNLTKR